MNRMWIIILLFPSFISNAQIIDFNNFSEERLNEVIFDEMNLHVKRIHNGDSLIWSAAVQKDIMPDNYNLIKNNAYKLPLIKLHNTKWIVENDKGLPDMSDTIKSKIINELSSKYSNSPFLQHKCRDNDTLEFIYSDILAECSIPSEYTYQKLANHIINLWKGSPRHAWIMNLNYDNKVIVGVTTFYDEKRKVVFVSFVNIS